jgi:hypothetical protein
MTGAESEKEFTRPRILTPEQDALLDLYIKKLDEYFEDVKASEKVQVEIETLHLKRMISQ